MRSLPVLAKYALYPCEYPLMYSAFVLVHLCPLNACINPKSSCVCGSCMVVIVAFLLWLFLYLMEKNINLRDYIK